MFDVPAGDEYSFAEAKSFLEAVVRAAARARCGVHLLVYCSSDHANRAAVEQALRHPAPAEEEPCDPFAEDYGDDDDEEVSEEDRNWERYEKRVLRQMERAERSRIRRIILDEDGIRTRDDLREEYRSVPNVYKRKDGRSGDEMAQYLSEHHPEFGIEDERDLIDVLSRGLKT